jgi:uncharacterized protein YndB with AHSA1/START domain
MIDVTHQVSAVARQVGARTLAAGEARVVTIGQAYPDPVDDVWDACTNPERIPRWFLPVSGDLRVGGRYQLEGNAGGTIERCDPPKGFGITWEYGGEVSWVEVRLTPTADGGTYFELDHVSHVDDERWGEFGPGAVGIGWDLGLVGLALHLTSGEGFDPSAGQAWAASADGRRFMTLAGEAWFRADVAGGADPGAARAAADRTIAAYTAPPEPPDA